MSDEETDIGLANSRSKRTRGKKNASAFERLKELKQSGSKNKWVNEESTRIYDEVDEDEYTKIVSDRAANDWIVDDVGEGYVEDGREIFDDEEGEEYEVQPNSNKRKSQQKRKGKLPDEPAPKKKSLKNFFNNKETKEKETSSVNDDNLLKNMLGELDGNFSVTNDFLIAPMPIKSIRKQATESEIEMKNYMERFGKKIQKPSRSEANGDDILNSLLKEERKQENQSLKRSMTKELQKENEMLQQIDEPEAVAALSLPLKLTPQQLREQEEAKEIMEVSAIDFEDEENLIMPEAKPVEKEKFSTAKIVNTTQNMCIQKNKAISTKTQNGIDATIFNELQGSNMEVDTTNTVNKTINFNTETTKFYYLDAWTDIINRPGEIYLFGKVQVPGEDTYNSICVRIENVNRHLFLLPRTHVYDFKTKSLTDQEVSIADVYQEFDERITKEIKITSFKSRKVYKSFAFSVSNVHVPLESEYLEVVYSGKYPTPNLKNKYSTIAHIFGTNTSPIETFILERKIKGPCWLDVKNFKVVEASSSWTKNQITCPDINCISVSTEQKPPPPLTIATLNVKCILNSTNNRNEIVQLSCLVNDSFHLDKPNEKLVTRQFTGITRPSNKNWPIDIMSAISNFKRFKIFKFDNERALLTWFLSVYQNIDPDLIVTFDSNDCQLDIICNRITLLKIPNWSRIGRLKINQIPGKKVMEFFIGRMVCDVKLSAQELIKSRSYDLGTLCQRILKIKEDERQEILYDNIPYAYDASSSIIEFMEINVQDCIYISKLMVELNILPLALQITNIAGNLMSRTLQGGRSERNEFLLMHAFYEKQYIIPDKKIWKDNQKEDEEEGENAHDTTTQVAGTAAGKKKAAYTGGLVLDPIKGFYESFILLMDFNSLYPSIIQEYNICYTTIAPPNDPNDLPTIPDSSVEQGILPRQIRRLVESRRDVKSLMTKPNVTPELKMQYNIRQLALKLTANSMYGCLGFSRSRFYAPHLAALVTFKGRDILMATKTLVEKLNHNVIYGDTDSIMINTRSQNYAEVKSIGTNIKKAVNTVYKHVELDIDGVYKKLLLLKKKKYAAVGVTQKDDNTLDYTYEFKGLDIVRRDWSKIASDTGKLVLNTLLAVDSKKEMDERIDEIFDILTQLGKDFNEDKIPLPMLEITKQLTKAPSEYADMSSLPHVQVADRMNVQKNRRFKKGDMIDYIICEDGTDNPAPKRGYHIDEIKADAENETRKLKVDKFYYLSQQIHPVISRLLEPIEGIDSAVIAEKIGLDPKDFRSKIKTTRSDNPDNDHLMIKTNEKKYRTCEKFSFPCVACKQIHFVAAPLKKENGKVSSIFEKCTNTECKVRPLEYLPLIKNYLRAAIVKSIHRFYENWFVCDNPMCNYNTQNYSWAIKGNLLCLACMEGNLQRTYTNEDLNMQIDYYNFMFNIRTYESEVSNLSGDVVAAYDMMLQTVAEHLENSNYFTVELKHKLVDYEYKLSDEDQKGTDKKLNWKQFFAETYAAA
ncbi:hypothetical protein PVAND_003814 [Polypedilum vanderplanki]|uniref:DNA polymerase n=1 Tax=Polypedilum vanderplanki TaxID=319348 RepID=A0A9J6BW97_POLVA|nr:hypothetical protein PVAND_003814 [Polypedilum vanderplanki]